MPGLRHLLLLSPPLYFSKLIKQHLVAWPDNEISGPDPEVTTGANYLTWPNDRVTQEADWESIVFL